MKKSNRVTEVIKESKQHFDEGSFHKVKPLTQVMPPQLAGKERDRFTANVFVQMPEYYTDVMLAMTGGGVLIGFALAGAMR